MNTSLAQLPSRVAGSLPPWQQILDTIKPNIFHHGIQGFWFQGVALCAYDNYHSNCRSNLFTPHTLRRAQGVLCSSPKIRQLHQHYVSRVATSDPNFAAALQLQQPYCYGLDPDTTKAGRLFHSHGIHQVLSWPLLQTDCHSWAGRFTLLSDNSIDTEQLGSTLEIAQMKLFQLGRERFNPYRQGRVFTSTALGVLALTARGLHNHQIAEQLHLTVRGVEYHLEAMRKKLAASNRANLIHIAHQLEII
ncbi:helix-turn-helix transcriptional regulator [Ferrimonas kyonanensis]|uniref:helix-turn-helix transcriptional regulator n=1 Tax=Ferrimonas kyonanensis TaxID=364763 RepID=UPI00047FF758|nr:helix-turn-helix transcriptional regulator [Ferrimonas kyonanensis]